MANYYSDARSNYFRVRSPKAFDKFCKIFGLEKIEDDEDKELVGFLSQENGIPSSFEDRTTGDYVETEFIDRLSRQLAPGAVAVVMEIGSEKMCYLTGYAVAINSSGAYVQVDLQNIYDKLKEITPDPTKVEACEY